MWGYNASASPTLNTTQMALSTLKDRCAKQQKKLDDLEREKLVLQMENESLAKSLHRLDEDNMVLRERNLEVSHELKQNSYEVVELRRHLSSQGVEEPMSLVVAEENPEDLLGKHLNKYLNSQEKYLAEKQCENTTGLHCLDVNNFDFTRKLRNFCVIF